MTLSLSQSVTAIGPGAPASFLALGGTGPYSYAVTPGGAGGSIDSSTGEYTGPAAYSSDPLHEFDTVVVTDSLAVTASAQIFVGSPLMLFCDIIEKEMGLADGRVYLWDQKIMQPTDSALYVAVSVPSCRPFANVNRAVNSGSNLNAEQFVSMLATVDIDIISRGPEARDRKEEVILALNSIYAQQQQEINGFYIGKISPTGGFINLSQVDGAAIPYRYKISVNMQYCVAKTSSSEFFNTFTNEIVTNS